MNHENSLRRYSAEILRSLARALYKDNFLKQKFHELFNILAQNIHCGYMLERPRLQNPSYAT